MTRRSDAGRVALAALAGFAPSVACRRAAEPPRPTAPPALDAPPATVAIVDAQPAGPPPPAPRAVQLALGDAHSCALLTDGTVHCWGLGTDGRLGLAGTTRLGDDERGAPAVDLGGPAVALAAGFAHTCALLATGKLRCWGRGAEGQLGHGSRAAIGDDETPASAGDVPLAEAIAAIAAGGNVTCALLTSNAIRCWGENREGRLGYGGLDRGNLGDDEAITARAPIRFDRPVAELAVGAASTCVRFDGGAVRCWGWLTGTVDAPGGPATDVTDVELGVPAAALALTPTSQGSCAITTSGRARCWGQDAALGYDREAIVGVQSASTIGNAPDDLGDLPLPGTVTSVHASGEHGCALFTGGDVRCWGDHAHGLLGVPGHGHVAARDATTVELGAPATALALSDFHSCAITDRGGVRCWGLGKDGRLGYGATANVGDRGPPATAGDVPLR